MYKLGKKAARHGAVKFKFGDFFDPKKLPTPPAVFGHHDLMGKEPWHVLGNDKYGCCVWSGAAHEHYVWSLEGGRDRARFTTKDILSDYTATTGFNPARKDTDHGTDMQQAASYRRTTGVLDATGKRHTIDAYIALQPGNMEQMVLATWLMGAAGLGFQFPDAAMDQFDAKQVWDIPVQIKINGGHYVPSVGRNAAGNLEVVTWGRLQEMTPAFYERFADEALAYVSLEILNDKNLSPEGFDADGLRAHLDHLKAS